MNLFTNTNTYFQLTNMLLNKLVWRVGKHYGGTKNEWNIVIKTYLMCKIVFLKIILKFYYYCRNIISQGDWILFKKRNYELGNALLMKLEIIKVPLLSIK